MHRHIHDKETRIYHGCLFLLPVFALLAFLISQERFIPDELLPPCLFHTLTGFSCPGCGCTRAVLALLRGDLLQSLRFNPGVLYCAVLYVLFVTSHTIEYFNNKKIPSHRRRSRQGEGNLHRLLNQIHGMKARPVYLYILIWLFLIFGILRFFAELWQHLQ